LFSKTLIINCAFKKVEFIISKATITNKKREIRKEVKPLKKM